MPAKVKRPLSDEEREAISVNAVLYVDLAKAHRAALAEQQDEG